jgi:hypothetical protein
MLLMASLRSGPIRWQWICVLPEHKSKGRGPVNTLHSMLQCGISFIKAVDFKDLSIEQTV